MTKNCRPWTRQEEGWLVRNYESAGPEKCAIVLKRTKDSVYTKATRMGLYYEPFGCDEKNIIDICLSCTRPENRCKGSKQCREFLKRG